MPIGQTNLTNSQMAVNNLKPLADMYRIFEASNDPMGTLKQAALSNTQFGDILQMTQAANGDPKQALYAKAKSMNLSDAEINDGFSKMESLLGIKKPN